MTKEERRQELRRAKARAACSVELNTCHGYLNFAPSPEAGLVCASSEHFSGHYRVEGTLKLVRFGHGSPPGELAMGMADREALLRMITDEEEVQRLALACPCCSEEKTGLHLCSACEIAGCYITSRACSHPDA